jgi:hypothetical protein
VHRQNSGVAWHPGSFDLFWRIILRMNAKKVNNGTVLQQFKKRPWYHPTRLVGEYLGVGQHPRATAAGRFAEGLPVVGQVMQAYVPAPDPDIAYRAEVSKSFDPTTRWASPNNPYAQSKRRNSTARSYSNGPVPIVKSSTPKTLRDFDSTMGYPGEGPPSKRTAKRKARRAKAKASLNKTTPVKAQANVTMVRAPARPVRTKFTSNQSYRATGTVLLADLNGLVAAIAKYQSMLAATVTSTGPGTTIPPTKFFDLNPYSVSILAQQYGLPTCIEAFADYFEQWEGKFKFRWRAGCGNSTNGQLMWWKDEDPTDKDQGYFGTASAVSIASQHGAVDFPVYMNYEMAVSTPGRRWLRQASGADIRKVSAGHMFFMTNQALAQGASYGQLFVEYDITFHQPCAKELNYESQYSITGVTSVVGNLYLPVGLPALTTTKMPISNTVVPYTSDTMLAPVGIGTTVGSNVLVLNHNYITPRATYVQVHANWASSASVITGADYVYTIGGQNVTGVLSVLDLEAADSADGGIVFTCFVPAGTPPDAAQVAIYLTSATAGSSVNSLVWTLPSVLFENDFDAVFDKGTSTVPCQRFLRYAKMECKSCDRKSSETGECQATNDYVVPDIEECHFPVKHSHKTEKQLTKRG